MNESILFRCAMALVLLLAVGMGCGAARLSRPPGVSIRSILYNEQAGEGDLSLHLEVRADSTFYQYRAHEGPRSWSGRTEPARWNAFLRLCSATALARTRRLTHDPGYDGHSASLYLQGPTATQHFSFDFFFNGPKLQQDPLLAAITAEASRLYTLANPEH